MKDLISIITPCYNSEAFIQATIVSVQNQTYTNWEMIIVDDVSSDNSINLIKKFSSKDSRIQCIQLKENSGAAVCRNTAIEKAKGKYIAFLDSDDLWLPEKLEKQYNFMTTNNYELTFGSYSKIDEEGRDTPNSTVKVLKRLSYKDMLTSNKMGCLTVMYNSDVLGKMYMPLIRKRQDYALWLKILKKIPYAYGFQEIIGKYRIREASISSSKIEMLKWNWKLFYKIEQRSLIASVYSVFMNVCYKLFK